MCGIIGYIGTDACSNKVLIEGLRALEYRGYDSAGIANVVNDQVQLYKAKGNVSALQDTLAYHHAKSGAVGIAHTRWATHGEPSIRNAHPHQVGLVTLVHNGIIENYMELKEELKAHGIGFYSDTDSEVAAAYIDYLYGLCKNKQKALSQAYQKLRGSFAFAILFSDELHCIYAMRKQSPLILGVGTHASYVASDLSAFLSHTKHYIELDYGEIARLDERGIVVKNLKHEFVKKAVHTSTMKVDVLQKGGFAHFMLKEIYEEPDVIQRVFQTYIPNHITDLMNTLPDLSSYEEVHIVACGSAMHAGMIAQILLERYAGIRTLCSVASEYRYATPIYQKHTLVIVISQSGETADTIAALQMAKEHGIDTVGIVNVVGSTIAKLADHVLYTCAGPEISVATTKAYCAQVALLSLLSIKFAYSRNRLNEQEISQLQEELTMLCDCMKPLIANTQYKEIAKIIAPHHDVYFIGRGLDYALSMEGSLKLKEISYIHSEAYPAGELKHGTISLIEEKTPVIAIATSAALYEKTISNIKEVKARGAHVILMVDELLPMLEDVYDERIILPHTNPLLQGILSAIPLQLIAYETALLRGCEIDQPRNLAKSVTVE